jgi:hypothetical protein
MKLRRKSRQGNRTQSRAGQGSKKKRKHTHTHAQRKREIRFEEMRWRRTGKLVVAVKECVCVCVRMCIESIKGARGKGEGVRGGFLSF